MRESTFIYIGILGMKLPSFPTKGQLVKALKMVVVVHPKNPHEDTLQRHPANPLGSCRGEGGFHICAVKKRLEKTEPFSKFDKFSLDIWANFHHTPKIPERRVIFGVGLTINHPKNLMSLIPAYGLQAAWKWLLSKTSVHLNIATEVLHCYILSVKLLDNSYMPHAIFNQHNATTLQTGPYG